MATKAVKGVNEDAWNTLKSIASGEGLSMGEFFNRLAGQIRNGGKSQWEKILDNRVEHTGAEWAEIEKRTRHFRKTFEFRRF